MSKPVELKLEVPTYYGKDDDHEAKGKAEWDSPHVPVLVREAEGLRIVLGSRDYDDCSVPDIQIERQPGGWVIFLHPEPGGDPSGYVYFLDDGRSFVHPERLGGITVLDARDPIPPELCVPTASESP